MQLQIKGQVKFKSEVSVISDKFSKQTIWVAETEGEYKQTYELQAINKNIDKLQGFNVNDIVVVDCNVNGKVVNTKNGERVFNSLDIWKISKNGEVQPPQPQVGKGKIDVNANPVPQDDLPF